MSAETMGMQHQLAGHKAAQASGDEPRSPSEANSQELLPDQPPLPVKDAAQERVQRPRGFAAMERKLVSEIARKGGKAAHSAGTAHEFTSEEARIAGRKGGRATHAKRRSLPERQAKQEPQQNGE